MPTGMHCCLGLMRPDDSSATYWFVLWASMIISSYDCRSRKMWRNSTTLLLECCELTGMQQLVRFLLILFNFSDSMRIDLNEKYFVTFGSPSDSRVRIISSVTVAASHF